MFTLFHLTNYRTDYSASASMETSRKARKPRGLSSFLKAPWAGKNRPQTSPLHITMPIQANQGSIRTADGYVDSQRTKDRYLQAAEFLHQAVKGLREEQHWESFKFPDLSGEPENFDDAHFRDRINLALDSRKTAIRDQTFWTKCKNTVECIFAASSPFAKNFLMIAKEAQSVMSSTSH